MQLDAKQLKVLGIIQSRKQEYMDAIGYVMGTLNNQQQAAVLLPIAEKLK